MKAQLKISPWLAAILATALIVAAVPAQPAQVKPDTVRAADPSYDEMDAYVEGQLEALNIPGAALVIVEGDRIAHFKGFGVTGPGGAAPTPQTPYFIGSVTKSFTALAVMQLAEEGKVDLDAPLQRYLPWFTLADSEAAAEITIRHLLNQTSSLGQTPGMIALTNFDAAPGAAERQARALANYRLPRPAGAEFEYSNLNFNLLGLVVEAASGEPYAEYVKNHIFRPLNMAHSFTSKSAARQDGLATGQQQWFGSPVAVPDLPVPEGSLASGQLIASAEDLGHYLIAQLNEGRYGDQRLLSPQGVASMHRPAVSIDVAGNHMGEYSMGWFVIEKNQARIVFHDGEVPDAFSYTALLPEKKRAVALLINTNHQVYNYAMWALGEDLAVWLAGYPPAGNAWPLAPWLLRASLLLPVFQVLGIASAWKRIDGWRVDPARRPGAARLWMIHTILPGLLDVFLIAIPAGLLAAGMYKFLFLFLGDLVAVFTLCGVLALGWLVLRGVLIYRLLRGD